MAKLPYINLQLSPDMCAILVHTLLLPLGLDDVNHIEKEKS
jgi:hypothetical protein